MKQRRQVKNQQQQPKKHLSLTPEIRLTLDRAAVLGTRLGREQQQALWIEGIRHFVMACDAGVKFETIIYSPILLKNDLVEMLSRKLKGQGITRFKVSPEQFRLFSQTERASGIGAIIKLPWMPLSKTNMQGIGYMVVEKILLPGNLGTILRTAEAVGASGVIFIDDYCDPFDANVIRASMGGAMTVPLCRVTREHFEQWLIMENIHLTGLTPDGTNPWTNLPSDRTIAFAVGEERTGLSPWLRELCHSTIHLPIHGHADSINVSIASGVMWYELVRRRM